MIEPSSKTKDSVFPSISSNQTFFYQLVVFCRPGLPWIGFHQGHKEIQPRLSQSRVTVSQQLCQFCPLAYLALPQFCVQFCLMSCLIFIISFSSLSRSIVLPVTHHFYQILATCPVLFSSTYDLQVSVGSPAWYIAVLIPEWLVVCDNLNQSQHPTYLPDLQPPSCWPIE